DLRVLARHRPHDTDPVRHHEPPSDDAETTPHDEPNTGGGRAPRSVHRGEGNVLGALPDHQPAELRKPLPSLDDGQEVIPRQLPQLAGKAGRTVGYQNFRLAVATGVEENLARSRIARRVLEPDAELEVPERHPGRLTAPPGLDQLALERQQFSEGRARLRRGLLLPLGHKL